MSLLNGQMPEVGSPEYFAMLDRIPADYANKSASNKSRFESMMQGAGLNSANFDYGQISPEIFDAIGSKDPRALALSNFDQSRDQRVMDSQAYINAAKKAIAGGLTDAQMWQDYDANKYRQSGFQNFMQSGIKAGLGAMIGAGIGDAAGLWNLGGGETAALSPSNVSALTPASTAASPYSLGSGTATFGQGSALSTGNALTGTQVAGMGGGTGLTLGGSGLPSLAAMGGGTGLLAGGMGSTGAVGATGAGAGALGGGAAATGGSLLETIGTAVKPVTTAIKGINDLTGGNLGAIVGGLAGAAASGDTTTSASKDPWGPAQSYLKDNLAQNKRMQDYYSANPFSQEQKQAYQGLLNTNANGISNAGNYNQIAQNFMGSNRGLMGQMPTLNSGVNAPAIDWTKYANIGKGG